MKTTPAKLTKPMQNRIVGSEIVPVDQLTANPENWRIHSEAQQQALAGAIDDIGYIRSVTVNRRTGNVIDGHARIILAMRSGETEIPVEYVDLSEDDEKKALLTLDPIAAMAAADREKLDYLLRQVQSDDERIQELVSDIGVKNGVIDPVLPDYDAIWEGMPEFAQENRSPVKSITINFAALDDLKPFSELIGQKITDKTKSIWYPKKDKEDLINFRCVNES